jgi:hypothetical protein
LIHLSHRHLYYLAEFSWAWKNRSRIRSYAEQATGFEPAVMMFRHEL